MKKLMYIAFTFLLFTGSIATSNATEKEKKELTTAEQLRIEQIAKRVDEIKELDRTKLNSTEKKALRNELTNIKKEANAISNGGVYLSLTALLVIIVLLLIL
jgi:hypothetical protein